jgi:hypothetical protein
MISDERIEEFRNIYRKAYGEELAVTEAREVANRLIALYRLLKQPLPAGNDSPLAPGSQARSDA